MSLNSKEFYRIFNRHIGRVMTFLDMANSPESTKYAVKGELWQLHDDILQIDLTEQVSKNSNGELINDTEESESI